MKSVLSSYKPFCIAIFAMLISLLTLNENSFTSTSHNAYGQTEPQSHYVSELTTSSNSLEATLEYSSKNFSTAVADNIAINVFAHNNISTNDSNQVSLWQQSLIWLFIGNKILKSLISFVYYHSSLSASF